jgi:DNA-binding NtrC family response regulator
MSGLTTHGYRDIPVLTVPPGDDRITGRFRTLSILCVYEDPLFLDRVCRNLERGGDMFVEISVSVEDALHLMVYVFFDVIVTDLTIWDEKPNGFLKAVRQQGKQVPFIYFARGKNAEIVKEAREYGMVKYLPWDETSSDVSFDELSRCIYEMAGKHA